MINGGAFSPRLADQAMVVAAATYLQPVKMAQTRLPFANVTCIDNVETGTYVLLVEWADLAFASFRGTQVSDHFSLIDVIRNMKIRKRIWRAGGRVHRGYADGIDSVLNELYNWVQEQKRQGQGVLCTGHSMGGVEAIGAASVLPFDATYTFGAPRFGNAKFAKLHADKPVYRIVHAQDIAPSFPHKWLGYRHLGERWQLDSDGGYSQIDGRSKDFWHYPYLQGKEDHTPVNYLKATKKGHFKDE